MVVYGARSIFCFILCFMMSTGSVLEVNRKCFMDGPIADLKELEPCTFIIGHLEFAEYANDTATRANINIALLQGCVFMENTNIADIDFITRITSIICEKPNYHHIMRNRYMCMSEEEEDKFKERLKQSGNIEIPNRNCPVCMPANFAPGCKTYVGDMVFGSSSSGSLLSLTRIVGRLIVKNQSDINWSVRTVNMDDFVDRILFIKSFNSTEPAVHIVNSQIPNDTFFLNLEVSALSNEVINVTAPEYRMSRGLKKRIQFGMPSKKKVAILEEQPKECYINPDEQLRHVSDLLLCEKLIGDIIIDTKKIIETGLKLNASWTHFETRRQNVTFSGGHEMLDLFKNKVSIEYTEQNFSIVLDFKDYICFDSNIIDEVANKWFIYKHDRFRVKWNSEVSCKYFYGRLTEYHFRHTHDMKGKWINGSLYINETKYKLMQDGSDGEDPKKWNTDIKRFAEIAGIKKSLNIPFHEPALSIAMCGSSLKLPDFVFNIHLSSDREDDLLLKISGPSYKMSKGDYDKLVKIHSMQRIDIQVLHSHECPFFEPIRKLEQLDGCEWIIGDLELNEHTKGSTNTTIRHVTGCIHIVNTTLKNLDFLDFDLEYNLINCHLCKGDHGFAIKNNTQMCVDYRQFGKRTKPYISGNKPGCGSEIGEKNILDKSVVIFREKDNSTLDYLRHIQQINGRVFVVGNTASTLDVFPNLQRIIWKGDCPALVVENNYKLTSIAFPKLTEVKCKNKKEAIRFKNNPLFSKEESDAVKEKFKKTTSGEVVVENEKEDETPPNYMGDGMRVGFGYGMGVVGGIALIAIVIGATIGIVKVFRKRKSPERKSVPAKNQKGKLETNGRKIKNSACVEQRNTQQTKESCKNKRK